MCRDVAAAMEFLETSLIAHRDLAARNVLLTADLRCEIAYHRPPTRPPSLCGGWRWRL